MSTNSPQGRTYLGKYELREQIGRGGMAEVWKAFDTQLERLVAIKLLHADLQADPEFITRFTREARVIASLHHPNIVQIHDFQTTHSPESNAPPAYMVMDYVEGQTLSAYIRDTSRAGKFPPAVDIVHLFTSIGKAIDYAHQRGMIHRDIKPANILLDQRNKIFNTMGEPVLTDFGIAKLLGAMSVTVSGAWLGTPLYISPEQAQGQPGNERSDIYSLGIILYEVCTGVQPFQGETAKDITEQHINTMPTAPSLINPRIPAALTAVILRAMAKDPAARFSTASAMAMRISEAFNISAPMSMSKTDLPPDNIAVSPPYYISPIPNQPQLITPLNMQSPSESFTHPAQIEPRLRPQTTPIDGTRTPIHSLKNTSTDPIPLIGNRNQQSEDWQNSFMPLSPPSRTPPITPRRKKWWPFIALFAILLLLVATSIEVFNAFPAKHTKLSPSTAIVGNVLFFNSEQLNAQNSQGVDDEVQIDLHSIPDPAPGKSYYAWLKNASTTAEGTSILLGTLQVNQGNAKLTSPYVDPQHTNLLANTNSFLVTEEDSNLTPVQPSTDRGTWIYYSEPSLVTLLHLRHLLAGSPELNLRQLYGGMAVWFWRNMEKVVEWASSARDDVESNPPATDVTHRQLIRILDYIDGAENVHMDIPHAPLYVNQHDAQIPLVGPEIRLGPPGDLYNKIGEVIPGYIYLMRVHLDAAVEAPQATAGQHQLANQIDVDLNQVRLDLEQVRNDAKQLVNLNGKQLMTPEAQSILNDLVTQIQVAYAGSVNPGQPQGNATLIYTDLQRMASFDIQPYSIAK